MEPGPRDSVSILTGRGELTQRCRAKTLCIPVGESRAIVRRLAQTAEARAVEVDFGATIGVVGHDGSNPIESPDSPIALRTQQNVVLCFSGLIEASRDRLGRTRPAKPEGP